MPCTKYSTQGWKQAWLEGDITWQRTCPQLSEMYDSNQINMNTASHSLAFSSLVTDYLRAKSKQKLPSPFLPAMYSYDTSQPEFSSPLPCPPHKDDSDSSPIVITLGREAQEEVRQKAAMAYRRVWWAAMCCFRTLERELSPPASNKSALGTRITVVLDSRGYQILS